MNELKKVKPYSLTISVSDIDMMTNWYEEKIGFERLSSKPIQVFNSSIQFLVLNGFHIELIENPNSQNKERIPPPAHTTIQGIVNFCLGTANLGKIKEELAEKQVPILWSSENKALGMKMLLIQDLEENLIQYLEKITE